MCWVGEGEVGRLGEGGMYRFIHENKKMVALVIREGWPGLEAWNDTIAGLVGWL